MMNDQNQKYDDTEMPAQPLEQQAASVLDQVPPPRIRWGSYGEIGVYGMSLQGRSHKKTGAPCQDSNNFCYLENEKILIAAIADGVGSCIWSHWGSYTAVESAIMTLKREIEAISQGEPLKIESLTANQIESLFNAAFSGARMAVEELADREKQSVYNFQSTLTVALYDGSRLTCCHIGDDGIVAQGTSGKYQMITQRIKGDEANSVVTLQSGKWFITTTSTEVTGFLLSTDGILDFYVMNQAMSNRVYYPFFEACIYPMEPKQTQQMESCVENTMKETQAQLLDDDVMGSVTDDMTVLAVANQRLLCQSVHPVFSEDEWNSEIRRIRKMQQEKLHPPKTNVPQEPIKHDKPEIKSQPVPTEVPSKRARTPLEKNNRKIIEREAYRPRTVTHPPQADPARPHTIPIQADREKSFLEKLMDGMGKGMFGEMVIEVDESPYVFYRRSEEYYRDPQLQRKHILYCPNPMCGKRLEGKEKFCPHCGRQLKN